jgi:SsrA-binding protein
MELIVNNKFRSNTYRVEKVFESGIILFGWEVKGLRKFPPNLKKCFIYVTKSNKVFLVDSVFYPFLGCNSSFPLIRKRELLLNRREIIFIKNLQVTRGKSNSKLFVSRIYWKKKFIKVELIVVKLSVK